MTEGAGDDKQGGRKEGGRKEGSKERLKVVNEYLRLHPFQLRFLHSERLPCRFLL